MSSAASYELRVATRNDGSRDGELVLVDAQQLRCAAVPRIARSLQAALDDWSAIAPRLEAERKRLDAGDWHEKGTEPFDPSHCMAPLPRAYQWVDASVYRNHARLMYRWRNEPIPPRYEDEPLVYQGGSDVMLGPTQAIEAVDEAHGIDLEAEIGVITTDVPMGTSAQDALDHIALVVLLNDVSLRNLIPAELARGFGFYQSKPATAFAPVALTPAALGAAWRDAMLHLPVDIDINGQWSGSPDAGEETVFGFDRIIEHIATTRAHCAGSIVGAGTISNADASRGNACITEARVRQMLDGVPEPQLHPYLRHGDRVRIEVRDELGNPVFGAIDQTVSVRGRR